MQRKDKPLCVLNSVYSLLFLIYQVIRLSLSGSLSHCRLCLFIYVSYYKNIWGYMQHHMIQPERNEVQSCDMHDFTDKQGS